jgi:Family of unknown function (DUF6152)
MPVKQAVLAAGIGLLAATLPLVAHHSFAAEFDSAKPVSLQGVVTKLDWMNPHIWIYFDSKDDSGAVAHWQCEGGPPNTLTRNGWSRDSLKIGDQVNVEGFRSKDGTNTCNARTVKLPDGKRVFAGSAEDGGPSKKAPTQ